MDKREQKVTPDDLDLLQRGLEGDLSPAEAERFAALVSGNPEARLMLTALRTLDEGAGAGAEHDESEAVAGIMARVQGMPHPEPGGWMPRVRRRIARAAAWGGFVGTDVGVSSRVEDVMSNRAKLVWGTSAIAVALLAGVWFYGTPRVDEGADATIGAAKRYQAPQIAAKDVELGDTEVQAFMQSDTFDRILKDENARKLLANAEMRAMFANPDLSAAFADPEFAAAVRQVALADAAMMRA
ncbi:MAG: hypothetical protein H0X67_24415, partial [Acidobacteria bacterium]|nr:hypothetical protein [Acidobacteriota bacterium]